MTYTIETKDGKSIPCDLYLSNKEDIALIQHESENNHDGYHLYEITDGQRLHKTFVPLDNVSEIKTVK
jgi:hypothetical protein